MAEAVKNVKVKGMHLTVDRGENSTVKGMSMSVDLEVYAKPVTVELTEDSMRAVLAVIEEHARQEFE